MLEFKNVEFGYENDPLLQDISFKIQSGEFVFMIGKSGCGKSTLLQMIYMNLFPRSGEVLFDGVSSATVRNKDIPVIRKKLGIVFQSFKLLKNRTVFDNLAFILEAVDMPQSKIKKRVLDVLSEVGLNHKWNFFPEQLSGGEQQRVSIARAIINEPLLILADEPTGNLDPQTSFEILELLKKVNKLGAAVLLTTHNYELIQQQHSRIIKVENKKIMEGVFRPKDSR